MHEVRKSHSEENKTDSTRPNDVSVILLILSNYMYSGTRKNSSERVGMAIKISLFRD